MISSGNCPDRDADERLLRPRLEGFSAPLIVSACRSFDEGSISTRFDLESVDFDFVRKLDVGVSD